eukprot:TRINITY_DN9_c0_g2_i2.p1 TRINITY_DN9_c0_g2~~TRINITY_DN9_c0_g2_i2.p1  ORF type:complete len:266 (+),score=65.57 TRINITY_DN9_c0_g2_i2:47-844(+)
MSQENVFTPPAKIEEMYPKEFVGMNRPTAGAREQKELPVGKEDIQLYSLATPNGQKVSILLEELGVAYDAHRISINEGEQFFSGFVDVNPNSKIPALVDRSNPDEPINVFESGNILMYLADKYGKFVPAKDDVRKRTELGNWLMWHMAGQGPMTGNFGHFYRSAPETEIDARTYGVRRYGMEVQRLMSVLDKHLEGKRYILGDDYSVIDIACFTWWNAKYRNKVTNINSHEFLSFDQYKNLTAWGERIAARPAVQRGMKVCPFIY